MRESITLLFQEVSSWQWLEILRALAPVATALIALRALQTWRRQDKAKRQAELLDALLEAVHEFVGLMPRAIGIAENVAAAIIEGAPEDRTSAQTRSLDEELEKIRPVNLRVRSLATKGGVLGFKDFAKCQAVVRTLVSQYTRLQRIGLRGRTIATLGTDQALSDIHEISNGDVRIQLTISSGEFLEYVSKAYSRIYG